VFFFQAEDGIRDFHVTGVQTCALPIFASEPPVMMISALPVRMYVKASINAWVDDAHADTAEKLGPRNPWRIEIWPGAISINILRSEERRVGKECRTLRRPYQQTKKIE